MNKRKGIVAVLLMVAMLMSLVGCAGKFDASGYTKAVLDANFKNETKEYAKLTDSTQEEAEEIFSENLDYLMDGFEELGQSDEMGEDFRQLFEDLLKSVKYSVGEAKEGKEGNFTVDVTVEPITNFKNLEADFTSQIEAYVAKITEDMLNGAEQPSEAEMQTEMMDMIYTIMKESMDAGITYDEPETITVHVNKDGDNVYEIPDEDLEAVTDTVIAMDLSE